MRLLITAVITSVPIVVALALAGCVDTPAVIIKPPGVANNVPQKIQGVRGALSKAASSGVNAANDIKLKIAAPMTDATLAYIGKDADFIITQFNDVQRQDAELSALQADSANAQVNWNSERAQLIQQITELAAKYEALAKERDQLKDDLDSAHTAMFKWLIAGAIALGAIGVGAGIYLGNTRLAIAAGITGSAGASAAVLVGAIYRWSNVILLSIGVVFVIAVIVGIVYAIYRLRKNLTSVVQGVETAKAALGKAGVPLAMVPSEMLDDIKDSDKTTDGKTGDITVPFSVIMGIAQDKHQDAATQTEVAAIKTKLGI